MFQLRAGPRRDPDFRDYVERIAAVAAVDDLTCASRPRGRTVAVDQARRFPIMSRAWAAAHDADEPGRLRGGEETYASRHANGTGPFRLEPVRAARPLGHGPQSAWWGGPTSRTTSTASLSSPTRSRERRRAARRRDRSAADPPYSAVDQIRRNPGLKLVYGPKLLTMFFGLDQGSAELRSSNIKGRNPFKDRRVRAAMAYAMDMKSALHDLMGDLFIPAGMIAAPGVNGYSATWIRRRFAILRSRRPCSPRPAIRMASASPSIARTIGATTRSPNARPPPGNSAPLESRSPSIPCRRRLRGEGMPSSAERLPSRRHAVDLDSERILRGFVSQSWKYNLGGYANPRVDELLDKIDGEMVTYGRDAYLEEAWKIVTDDFVYLPIRHGVSVFAMRKNLDIPPDPWDFPRFRVAISRPAASRRGWGLRRQQ